MEREDKSEENVPRKQRISHKEVRMRVVRTEEKLD
jgi:hypothetical protein